ncbi:MAG TPA: dipeptidase [Candidatus Kapabacteria bacterium]|nr:dipeptidase [Candidatus Kapabacteria bacterium]
MSTIQTYVDANKDKFLDELKTFLRIPSISTLPDHKQKCAECAEHLRGEFTRMGFTSKVIPTAGHPVVYAEDLAAGKNAPTVLFYGHYDVQPVDPVNLWTNPPFEPTIRGERLYARGSVDDKGQVHLQMKGLETLRAVKGSLPCNVKVIIEGEEEIGSVNLEQFLREHSAMLACNTVMISDTAMFALGYPTITYGLRGLTYFELKVTSANTDLHSGMFGGAVENPINVLCSIIAKLKDEYGRIAVSGFYDDVLPLSAEERKQFASLPFSEQNFCNSIGIPNTRSEYGYSTLEQLWARPTLDVNGIWGGFTEAGAKTVLPAIAHAKISMRLVPNQSSKKIEQLFIEHIKRLTPPTVKMEITPLHGGEPALTPMDSPGNKAAQAALRLAFGKEPVFVRDGGSIPIVLLFQDILKAPVVLMGFGLPDENAHAPDENIHLENYFYGIKSAAHFYDEFAKTAKNVR